jgi:hypothetical protein
LLLKTLGRKVDLERDYKLAWGKFFAILIGKLVIGIKSAEEEEMKTMKL